MSSSLSAASPQTASGLSADAAAAVSSSSIPVAAVSASANSPRSNGTSTLEPVQQNKSSPLPSAEFEVLRSDPLSDPFASALAICLEELNTTPASSRALTAPNTQQAVSSCREPDFLTTSK